MGRGRTENPRLGRVPRERAHQATPFAVPWQLTGGPQSGLQSKREPSPWEGEKDKDKEQGAGQGQEQGGMVVQPLSPAGISSHESSGHQRLHKPPRLQYERLLQRAGTARYCYQKAAATPHRAACAEDSKPHPAPALTERRRHWGSMQQPSFVAGRQHRRCRPGRGAMQTFGGPSPTGPSLDNLPLPASASHGHCWSREKISGCARSV